MKPCVSADCPVLIVHREHEKGGEIVPMPCEPECSHPEHKVRPPLPLPPGDLAYILPLDANAIQIGGAHYVNKKIQPWDFIAANRLDFFQGSIVKYVVRFREKGGVEDLKKAKHYLEKLIELEG